MLVLAGPIAGWDAQVVKHLRGSQLTQLSQCDSMDPRIDRVHAFTTPQPFGHLVAERPNHETRMQRPASITLDVKPKLNNIPRRA